MSGISVKDLAKELHMKEAALIGVLKKMHIDVKTSEDIISSSNHQKVVAVYNAAVKKMHKKPEEKQTKKSVGNIRAAQRAEEYRKKQEQLNKSSIKRTSNSIDESEEIEAKKAELARQKAEKIKRQEEERRKEALRLEEEKKRKEKEKKRKEEQKKAKSAKEEALKKLKEEEEKAKKKKLEKEKAKETKSKGKKKTKAANKELEPDEGEKPKKKRVKEKGAVKSTPDLSKKPASTKKKKKAKKTEEILPEKKDFITIPENVVISSLASKLDVQVSDIVKYVMGKGIMASANEEIPFELAEEIALEYDMLVEKEDIADIIESYFDETPDKEEDLVKRSPVVVVMGHVDHGKTSLLDAIRKSNVTASEHGGITQHIGAYTVKTDSGSNITFLDTPGHEAFTAMRLRGALATDIAILVVAADDGVMPQTVEAINHAKAANVQLIVAINKIDKPGANPDRVMQELTEHGLVAEDWGGDTICVKVSATQKTGLDELLELINLVADVENYKANPNRNARGIIIEAQLDKGRGPVATVLVQNGTLKVGDSIVVGECYGRVRAMIDDKGHRVKSAGPSIPVEILGLSDVPIAGDTFHTASSDREARQIAEKVISSNREKLIQTTPSKVTLDDLFHQIQVGEIKELNVIVKADTQGSVEAVKQSLLKLSNEEVMIKIIHGGVGAIAESDVMLASASNAIIIGFNIRPDSTAKVIAEREKIDVRLYRVIYNAIEDIQAAMKGLLDPVYEEKVLGHIEIRQLFKVSGVGTIGGGYVVDGKVKRNSSVRLNRDNVVVYEGELASLKRFKDDVKEVQNGFECGIMLEKFNDIKEGDIVEAFEMVEIER